MCTHKCDDDELTLVMTRKMNEEEIKKNLFYAKKRKIVCTRRHIIKYALCAHIK